MMWVHVILYKCFYLHNEMDTYWAFKDFEIAFLRTLKSPSYITVLCAILNFE